jgi:enoyl-[acyl-carrier protein] reductase I
MTNINKTGLMSGKRGLIMGVANERSIAWGIAQCLHEHGAEIAFSYQGDALLRRVKPLAESLGSDFLFECDVLDNDSIENCVKEIGEKWGKIDFLVHAIAFSDKNELKGRYIDTTMGNFLNTMNISVFSFTNVLKHAEPILNKDASVLTISYYGAEKVMPNYNVMGVAKAALEMSVKYLAEDLGKDSIRVNAISAGTIKTLAAAGISKFSYILKWNEYNSPLRKNVTTQDVGKAAVYLLSDLGSGTTGEILHVDSGYNVVGMKAVDAPDMTANVEASSSE